MTESLQQYFHWIIEMTRETTSANISAMLGQLLTSLLEFVVFSMLVPLRIMSLTEKTSTDDRGLAPAGFSETFMQFTQKHIGALTAESLRALGITILWTMCFVLPGVFKYIRYSFVPYVVVADPVYQRGDRDALKYSDLLVKGFTFELFILFMILFAAEIGRGHLREQFALTSSPVVAIIGSLLFFAFNIYANILLFRLYQLRAAQTPTQLPTTA